MPDAMPADAVLEREFLEMRAKILELASSLDRLERGAGDVRNDDRYKLLLEGIQILQQTEEGRAERVQLLFSLPFEPDWRRQLGV